MRGIATVAGAWIILWACAAMGQFPDIPLLPREADPEAPPGAEHFDPGMDPGMERIPGGDLNGREETATSEADTKPKPQRRHKVRRRRDPFWPVSHVQEGMEETAGSTEDNSAESPRPVDLGKPDWQGAERQIVIKGIIEGPGNSNAAVINGQVVQAGDVISVIFGPKTYKWKIVSITSKESIKFHRLSVGPAGK